MKLENTEILPCFKTEIPDIFSQNTYHKQMVIL